MRRLLHRIIRVLFFLLAGWMIWVACYASSHGFSRKWRYYVTREFHKRGVEIEMSRLTLDPLHGLVAREVRIIDPRVPGRQFAVIDRVVLDINYSNLLHGEPFLNAVDLHDADLSWPLDAADSESPRVEISRLNARLLLPPHQFYLSEAEARIFGVQISARGRLLNPEAFRSQPVEGKEGKAQRQELLTHFFKDLRAARFPDGPPRIEIEFNGDLTAPKTLFVEATVWGQKIQHGSYQLENLFAALRYRDGVCTLTRCTASDARGAFDASGSYDFAAQKMTGQVRSTLDVQALTHSLRVPHTLDEFVFYESPLFEMSGEAVFGDQPQIKLLGRTQLKKFAIKSAVFDGASANFSYDGARWYVRDFSLRNRTGALTLNALQLPGNFRSTLQSTLNPRSLLPLISGKPAQILGEWDFLQAPQIRLTASMPSLDFEHCEISGEMKLGRTRMRGVPLNSATAMLHVKDKVVTYENFKIERSEGAGTGTFAYDFGKHEVRLDNVKTTLNPGEVAAWIDPDLVHNITPYRFKTAPTLAINGRVGHDNTNLEILVDAPGGMDYTFLKKSLSFPKVTGRLLFTEGNLQISDFSGSLYSGQLRGSADISLKRDEPGYSAQLTTENVDFASVTKLYFNYENSHGLLNGKFNFRGRNSDARTLQGRGEISVIDGDVFSIPVLGPFSGILNGIVPKMGYNVARKASASFDVRDGVAETNDFVVAGQGFEMRGEGRVGFLDDKLNFNIRINAQGIPGVLLFPVSKLFEYVSDGSLSKAVWKPKRLPSL